jgi:hypothetical protein
MSADLLIAVLALAVGAGGGWALAFLATVPRHLPLDAAIPAQCSLGMPVLEAIEHVAAGSDVEVDARVARGRTYRHALEQLLAEEPVDRVIVPTSGNPRGGLTGDDLVWLLQRVPAEILILRPNASDGKRVTEAAVHGHF